jgi:hypothetical protein
MGRDILIMSGATVALGFIGWAFWGNPPMSADPRLPTARSFNLDPDLTLVSEQSPYMRSER